MAEKAYSPGDEMSELDDPKNESASCRRTPKPGDKQMNQSPANCENAKVSGPVPEGHSAGGAHPGLTQRLHANARENGGVTE